METTMTEHRPVGFVGATAHQFGLLWTSRRPLLLGVALLAVLVLAGDPWTGDPLARLLNPWPVWVALVGPIWAFAVFHNEGPSHRLYHWSLPVDRFQHTLARLLAGLLWLWTLLAVLIGVGALMAALDGNLWQLGEIDAAGWVNFFTGPLLGYLAISVLTVASDYPIRWLFGIVFVFPFLMSLFDEWLGLEELVETALEPLFAEAWGLFPVIIGALGDATMTLNEELYQRQLGGPDLDVVYWWPATALWIILLGVVVGLLATRHPDTLPRLRRMG